jgi:hypothetical protein
VTHPAAKGERFLAVAGDFLSMLEIAKILKSRIGAAAKRAPSRELPNLPVRLVALRDPAVKQILPEFGKEERYEREGDRGCWVGHRVRIKRRLWLPRRVWCG